MTESLAVEASYCRICVWNASDGSLVHSLTGHSTLTYVLDVHPFNPRIAMSAGYDGKIIVWDESWQQQEQHQLLAQSWIKFTGDLVTVSPDVFQVDLGVDEEFVLLASDGLWDYMNSSEAVSFVREQLRKHGDAQMACEALGQVALDVDVEDEHDEDSGDSNEDGDS